MENKYEQMRCGNEELRWGKRKRLTRMKLQTRDMSKVRDEKRRKFSSYECENSGSSSTVDRNGNTNGNGVVLNSRSNNGNTNGMVPSDAEGFVWPKFMICLTSEEKEKDFMDMKGSKLPQRPRKRNKFVQKTMNLISPGSWLSELCQERYEVQEKKSTRKKPKGLKGMKNLKSDSE